MSDQVDEQASGRAPHATDPSLSHGHGHGAAGRADPRTRRLVAVILIPLALIALIGLVLLWPDQPAHQPGAQDQLSAEGTVTAARLGSCTGTDDPGSGDAAADCQRLTVTVTTGPGAGSTAQIIAPGGAGPRFTPGDDVVMAVAPDAPPDARYQIIDFQRDGPMLLLAGLFAVAVVLFGRLRGLAALVGLGVSFTILLTFVVPAILAGTSPLLVAVVGSAVIMFSVLYLTHGFTVWTSVAVLGTLGSLTLTGLLGAVFTAASHFTGLATSEAGFLGGLYPQVDLRGLLLAGIVIGSLGVLDDVTVTQAVTVAELSRSAPGRSRRDLYRSATRVGRTHVASTVNTLVLAYAGASLPLLLLFTAGGSSSADILTTEIVAVEVVRAAVGSIGIVAAVPLTTWLAVLLLAQQAPPAARHRR